MVTDVATALVTAALLNGRKLMNSAMVYYRSYMNAADTKYAEILSEEYIPKSI